MHQNPTLASIVVIDDDPVSCGLLSAMIRKQAHKVASASNGADGLELVRGHVVDLILLDIVMPEMDGFQVLEALKQDEALRHIPVIVLSGLGDLDSAVRCIELGADDYLHKPTKEVLLQARIGSCLAKKRLRDQEQATLQFFQREMEIGRKIQADFLPKTLPVHEGWEIAKSFYPAREVSGDFYDAFFAPNGNIVLALGDVCGKGVGSALFMTLVRTLIRFNSDTFRASKDILQSVRHINEYINRHHNQDTAVFMFATLFLGILDPATSELNYVLAGHPEPIIVNGRGELMFLERCGPAVGIHGDAEFLLKTVRLERGDIMLTYTDGVTDAEGPAGMFEEERLFGAVRGLHAGAGALLDAVMQAIERHRQDHSLKDDVTMLALYRK